MESQRTKAPAPTRPARRSAPRQALRKPVPPQPRRPVDDGRIAAAIVVFSGS